MPQAVSLVDKESRQLQEIRTEELLRSQPSSRESAMYDTEAIERLGEGHCRTCGGLAQQADGRSYPSCSTRFPATTATAAAMRFQPKRSPRNIAPKAAPNRTEVSRRLTMPASVPMLMPQIASP